MRDWQPIATAPKDGTWFIGLGRDGDVRRTSWGRNRAGELAWCTQYGTFYGPTHWMPLPDPPSIGETPHP